MTKWTDSSGIQSIWRASPHRSSCTALLSLIDALSIDRSISTVGADRKDGHFECTSIANAFGTGLNCSRVLTIIHATQLKRKRPGPNGFRALLSQSSGHGAQRAAPLNDQAKALVDVVLLPVEGGVGLDDDVFVGGLLEFVDEHGFARF
jgi:hypothetical protein